MSDMGNDINIEKYKQVKTTDIAKNLGIGESTVRKYAQLLEEKGYIFRRDLNGARIYTGVDEVAINELKRLSKEGKMGVEMAATVVATRRKEENTEIAATQDVQPLIDQGIALGKIDDLMQDIRYIKESAATKEQVSQLASENELLKQKLDAAVEILQKIDEKQEVKQEKKGFWSRLLNL